jgi:DNA-binding beta-propeller fold protein YncE
MRRLSVGYSLLLLWLILAGTIWPVTPNCPYDSSTTQRAFPFAHVTCKLQVRYLGTYSQEGTYRASSRLDDLPPSTIFEANRLRPSEVPGNWNLHPVERTAHNFLPSVHAASGARAPSLFTHWRDELLTFVYGRQRALLYPQFLVTDPQGRLLVGDPVAGAVHVLDGEHSLRIAVGPQERLHSIAGVAADAEGNIYVGDADAGEIVVFDPLGRWLREIGRFNEKETIFEQLTGIAIDRTSARIYATDARRNAVLVFDLDGQLITRIGAHRHEPGVAFEHPTAITAKHGLVIVADMGGTRIQVLDVTGKLVRTLYTYSRRLSDREVSLDLDQAMNLYVTDIENSCVRVFSADGSMLATVGEAGVARGEFAAPSAVWVADDNRLYVADAQNRKVQVFSLEAEPAR